MNLCQLLGYCGHRPPAGVTASDANDPKRTSAWANAIPPIQNDSDFPRGPAANIAVAYGWAKGKSPCSTSGDASS
jgi:hypothetical protein